MWSVYFGETLLSWKMEAKCSSERSLRIHKTGRCHMSEHRNLNQWQTLGGFYDLTCNTSCPIHPSKFTLFFHILEPSGGSTQTPNIELSGAKLSKLSKVLICKLQIKNDIMYFKCSRPVVFYCLNYYKIPVTTQHVISIMLYSDTFRLIRVIIRLSLNHT